MNRMSAPSESRRKFPDLLPPTKVHYDGARPQTIQVRTCRLAFLQSGSRREQLFDQTTIRIGAMEDNDLVVSDETVSRFHCRIEQDEIGYLLRDLGSTNGTYVNGIRIREAYLGHGATISIGQTEVQFFVGHERMDVVASSKSRLGDIVGKNVKMRELYAIIEKIAPTGATVVIEGETGTGKEVVAQTIHRLSSRAGQSLMVFDCGAVPKNLIESELFGHEKGSFTGAIMTRQGLFEMAHNSTLFIDELGELPMELQPKLLRALEQREIRRVGAMRSLKIDVRIIAATNRNLEEDVRAGRFRQDLFYRLSVVRLVLPPLRDRLDDIPLLVESFLAEHSYNRLPDGSRKCTQVAPDAMELLSKYSWPGNIRELLNAIERAVSFASSHQIQSVDLPDNIRDGNSLGFLPQKTNAAMAAARPQSEIPRAIVDAQSGGLATEPRLDLQFKDAKELWIAQFERKYVGFLLKKYKGNISHAARAADIDRKYFRKVMRKYDLEGWKDETPDDDEE